MAQFRFTTELDPLSLEDEHENDALIIKHAHSSDSHVFLEAHLIGEDFDAPREPHVIILGKPDVIKSSKDLKRFVENQTLETLTNNKGTITFSPNGKTEKANPLRNAVTSSDYSESQKTLQYQLIYAIQDTLDQGQPLEDAIQTVVQTNQYPYHKVTYTLNSNPKPEHLRQDPSLPDLSF